MKKRLAFVLFLLTSVALLSFSSHGTSHLSGPAPEKADLTVDIIEAPDEFVVGASYRMIARIGNSGGNGTPEGTNADNSSFRVLIRIVYLGAFPEKVFDVRESWVNGLAEGKQLDWVFFWDKVPQLRPGRYRLEVLVDADSEIDEINENNNVNSVILSLEQTVVRYQDDSCVTVGEACLRNEDCCPGRGLYCSTSTSTCVVEMPDLSVKIKESPIQFNLNGEYEILTVISNTGGSGGNVVDSPFEIMLRLVDHDRPSRVFPVKQVEVAGLGGGKKIDWRFFWRDIPRISEGRYRLEAHVDSNHQIRESNETNNLAWNLLRLSSSCPDSGDRGCSVDSDCCRGLSCVGNTCVGSNSKASGAPVILGAAKVGETLTASISYVAAPDGTSITIPRISDPDGLPDPNSFQYQWILVDGNTETRILDATSSTYTLVESTLGKKLKVEVSFTDLGGNDEGPLASSPTQVVMAASADNSPASGAPVISGTAEVGETLTALTHHGPAVRMSYFEDPNGVPSLFSLSSFRYQWYRVNIDRYSNTEAAISGATSSTYTVVSSDVTYRLVVKVSFTDLSGNDEGPLASNPTQVVVVPPAVTNSPPVFTSGSSFSVNENLLSVGTVVAVDSDVGDSVTGYSVSGVDGSLFSITGGGVLTFDSAPDFESPADSGGNNVYNIVVTATSGTGSRVRTVTQSITVTVTDVDESTVNNPPVITGGLENSWLHNENVRTVGTVVASDSDSQDSVTGYSVSGVDGSLFSITGGGVLTFDSAPDFESPADSGGNNVYNIVVTATSGTGSRVRTVTQSITVTVTDVDESTVNNPPVITGGLENSWLHNENVRTVGTVVASDSDSQDSVTGYSVSGVDGSLFSITGGGVLTFDSAPDFESPADSGGNNVYNIVVTATSGTGSRVLTSSPWSVPVRVRDVDEPPVIVSRNSPPVFTSGSSFSVNENLLSVGTVVAVDSDVGDSVTGYSVSGVDGSLFSITGGGVLTFDSAPDFESPADSGGNNVYNIVVTATSGTGSRVLTSSPWSVPVRVRDVDEPPVIVSRNSPPVFTSGSSFSVNENLLSVGTVVAVDSDVGDSVTGYSVSGVDGSLFSITGGGVLTFDSAPDFESPADSGGNNVYNIVVTATSGTGSRVLTSSPWSVPVRVRDVDEPPVIVSRNSPPVFTSGSSFSVNENLLSVGTVVAVDSDVGDSVTGYSVSGVDGSLFSITGGGVLTFDSAPDFESPADSGGNNVYNIVVTATSGTGSRVRTVTQSITVTVRDVIEVPSTPSAPSLTASTNSIAVSWSAPSNRGPAINDYDVQYRVGSSGFFVNWGHGGTSTSTTIIGLAANTLYGVRVRAVNAEGDSAWSQTSSARTGMVTPPSVCGGAVVNICSRTSQVRDEILSKLPGVSCDAVPPARLELISYLNLNNTGISALKEGDFDCLTSLETLLLYSNELSVLPDGIFDDLPLRSLNIRWNELSRLDEDVFEGLTNLEHLNIGSNNLSSLPRGVFDDLTNLQYLGIYSNRLASLRPDVFDSLTNLRRLNIGSNNLSSLPRGVFDGLKKLDHLYIYGNNLVSLPPDVFDSLTSLRFLKVVSNPLASLRPDVFDNLNDLHTLVLYDNRLSSLPSGVFDNLNKLQNIDLRSNGLASLRPDVFEDLLVLRFLNVGNNPLVCIPPSAFGSRTDVSGISISPALCST